MFMDWNLKDSDYIKTFIVYLIFIIAFNFIK
jgi:hypothetical protein